MLKKVLHYLSIMVGVTIGLLLATIILNAIGIPMENTNFYLLIGHFSGVAIAKIFLK